MAKVTKAYAGLQDFILDIAGEENCTKREAERLLRVFLEVLEKNLTRPDKQGVQFIDFLTIERVMRKEKIGRNPKNPSEQIHIPARVGFKVNLGKRLKEELY